MGFFNNSTKIIPASGSVIGVLMPYSDKVLTVTEIDAKIQKAKGEIDYLTKGLASRITHGGKRFRARQISIKSRIGLASERLTLLASAKAIIEVEWEKKARPDVKGCSSSIRYGTKCRIYGRCHGIYERA